jgi:hypothetical protein
VRAALLVSIVLVIAGASAAPARAGFHFRERVRNAQLGSVRAEFRYKLDSRSRFWQSGRLRIWDHGRLIVKRADKYGYAGAYTLPSLAVVQLDATGPPEVVLNLYSGGAHCCFAVEIYTGKHRLRRDWGHFGAPVLRDVDGDGRLEFHGFDSNFAAAFGSFGSSRLPAKVWSYSAGTLTDVTSSYPAEVQADMAQQYAAYQEALTSPYSENVRAALAAYAADAYTLGQGEAAMAIVQAAVDAGGTAGGKSDDDPAYEQDYISTLRDMLRTLGYDKG